MAAASADSPGVHKLLEEESLRRWEPELWTAHAQEGGPVIDPEIEAPIAALVELNAALLSRVAETVSAWPSPPAEDCLHHMAMRDRVSHNKG